MQMIADVKIDGDRLLVTGPNNPPQQGGLVKAALLYDIADPANPERLAWWRNPDETQFWGAKVAGDRDVFVSGNM